MQTNNININRLFKKAFIALYCAFIIGSVIYVLLCQYTPGQNSLRALGSVSMDVVCLRIALVLVMSLTFESQNLNHSSKLFLCLMMGTMFGLFFDFLTWSFDGSLSYANWTYGAVTASLCSGSILAAALIYYIASYMDDAYAMKAPYISAKICLVCNGFSFVLTLVLAITKAAFTLDGGHYQTGMLYDVVTVIPIVTLLYMTGYVVAHHKTIGYHDVFAVVAYLLTMILGAIVEAKYGIGATYMAVTVADVIIYVMLQNRVIELIRMQQKLLTEEIHSKDKVLESMAGILDQEKKNVEKWIIRSNTDELTGFFNRNAYEEEVSRINDSEISDDFVYVSIDINALKTVNDTLGHAAGDELIIGACQCMEKCLGEYGKLYRTGGDEFAALIHADAGQLENIKADLIAEIENWHGTMVDHLAISCGYVLKKEAEKLSIRQIAVLADKRMYEDKNLYYQTNGIDRRGINY